MRWERSWNLRIARSKFDFICPYYSARHKYGEPDARIRGIGSTSKEGDQIPQLLGPDQVRPSLAPSPEHERDAGLDGRQSLVQQQALAQPDAYHK